MSINKGCIILVALAAGMVIGSVIFKSWPDIDAFMDLPARFYAKEYCSCRNVARQSHQVCHDFASPQEPFLALMRVEYVSPESVRVSLFGRSHQAMFVSNHFGCLLSPRHY